MLINRKISKEELRKTAGIVPNTMTKISRDEAVTLAVLEKICAVVQANLATLWSISRRKNMIDIRKLESEL